MTKKPENNGRASRAIRRQPKLSRMAEPGEAIPNVQGYGAVFYNPEDPEGTQFQLWSNVYERIMPGAFDETLAADDIVCAYNHDLNLTLAATANETLALRVDSVGLFFDATPLDTQTIRDQVISPIDSKICNGASFMFDPLTVRWVEELVDGEYIDVREISKVRLYEVGPVVLPAYTGTTAEVEERAKAELRDEFASWKGKRDRSQAKRRVEVDTQYRKYLDSKHGIEQC